MSMGSKNSGHAAVEIPAEGDLLAGGFGVDVEEDDLGGDLRQQLVGLAKGIVAGGHEDAALKVQDGVGLAVAELALVDAEAWGSDGVVGGAEHAAAALMGVGGN